MVWADGNSGSVEDSDTERRYHASVLLRHLKSQIRFFTALPAFVIAQEREERTGMVSNIIVPCVAVSKPDVQVQVYCGVSDRSLHQVFAHRPDNPASR